MPDWIAEIDPRFKPCVLPNAPLLMLGEGYAWLEGPVWMADANQLLVSDLPNDRILRWTEDSGVSIFRQPSNFANGHTRDRQGRLIGCSHRGRCITRTELDGSVTVLADRFDGKRLNGPNDVVVANDDAIWFSDPHYGGNTDYEGGKHDPELPPDCVPAETLGGRSQSLLTISPGRTDCVSRRTGAAFMWLKVGCSLPKMQLGTSDCSTWSTASCTMGGCST